MTSYPSQKLSSASIGVDSTMVPGMRPNSIHTELAKVKASAHTNNVYNSPLPPPAKPMEVVIIGKNNPVNKVEAFCSGSAEYTLSVIGILCIVYGIVAK